MLGKIMAIQKGAKYMTKSLITKKLNEYKKAGWLIYHWNDRRAVPSGAKGWVDHVLIHPDLCIILLLEIKIGRDKLNVKQTELLTAISYNDQRRWTVKYWVPTDETFIERIKDIDRITERGKDSIYNTQPCHSDTTAKLTRH